MSFEQALITANELMHNAYYDDLIAHANVMLQSYTKNDEQSVASFFYEYAEFWKCCERRDFAQAKIQLNEVKKLFKRLPKVLFNKQAQEELECTLESLNKKQLEEELEFASDYLKLQKTGSPVAKDIERFQSKLTQLEVACDRLVRLSRHPRSLAILERRMAQVRHAMKCTNARLAILCSRFEDAYQLSLSALDESTTKLHGFGSNALQYQLGELAYQDAVHNMNKSKNLEDRLLHQDYIDLATVSSQRCIIHFDRFHPDGSEAAKKVPIYLIFVYRTLKKYDPAIDQCDQILAASASEGYSQSQILHAFTQKADLYLLLENKSAAQNVYQEILKKFTKDTQGYSPEDIALLSTVEENERELSALLGVLNFKQKQAEAKRVEDKFKRSVAKAKKLFHDTEYEAAAEKFELCLQHPCCDASTALEIQKRLVDIYGVLSGVLSFQNKPASYNAYKKFDRLAIQGFFQKIIKYFKLSCQQDPNFFLEDRFMTICSAYHYSGDSVKAIKFCDMLIAQFSNSPGALINFTQDLKLQILYNRIALHVEVGDFPKALALIEQIIDGYSFDMPDLTNYGRGIIHRMHLQKMFLTMLLGEASEAALTQYLHSPVFSNVIDIDGDPDAYYILATIYFGLGQSDKVFECLNRSKKPSLQLRAACFAASGDTQNALLSIRAALAATPYSYQSYCRLGWLPDNSITVDERIVAFNKATYYAAKNFFEYQARSTRGMLNSVQASAEASGSAEVPAQAVVFPYVSLTKEEWLRNDLGYALLNRAVFHAETIHLHGDREQVIDDLKSVLEDTAVSITYRLLSTLQLKDLGEEVVIIPLIKQLDKIKDKTSQEIAIFSLGLLALDDKRLLALETRTLPPINRKVLIPVLLNYLARKERLLAQLPGYSPDYLQNEVNRRFELMPKCSSSMRHMTAGLFSAREDVTTPRQELDVTLDIDKANTSCSAVYPL